MATISIIGIGAVGTTVTGRVLPLGVAEKLTLYDRDADRARGEAVDFRHGASLLPECEIDGRGLDEMEAADLAVLTAGAHVVPGHTRLDLIDENLEAVSEIATAMERHELPRVVLVVTNPVDCITEYLTRRWESKGVRVVGAGTSLDSWRLEERIAADLRVHPANVHAWVIGEHGDSSVFLLHSATVGVIRLAEFAALRGIERLDEWLEDVQRDIRTAGYQVRRLKGSSTEAVALATARLVHHMLREQGFLVPVSIRVEDRLCASLPAVLSADGAGEPLRPEMSEEESRAWERSLDVLRAANGRIPI